MSPESRKAIDRRLARIEGQVRGLRRMIEADDYCCDVLTQLTAVRSALDHVGTEMILSHVEGCLIDPGGEHAHPKTANRDQGDLLDELRTTLTRLMR